MNSPATYNRRFKGFTGSTKKPSNFTGRASDSPDKDTDGKSVLRKGKRVRFPLRPQHLEGLNMLATANVKPGDILCVNTGNGFGARMIRLGAAVKEAVTGKPEPDLANHVAVVSHYDANGVLWALEGRPGGVGWQQATDYMASPYTISNVLQPKTDGQRNIIGCNARAFKGTQYDWEAIVDDAAQAFGLNLPGWKPQFGKVPGHLVCSSYAAYLYAKADLAHPSGDRNVSPADWVDLILVNNWEG